MKAKFSVVCLMLVFCMLLSVFVSCKGKKPAVVSGSDISSNSEVGNNTTSDVQNSESVSVGVSSAANGSVSNSVTTPPKVEVPTFPDEKIEDLKGATVTIATMWSDYWVSSKTNNSAKIREFDANVKKVGKDYNANIVIKQVNPSAMLDEITKAAAAGTKYADIIEAGPVVYYNLVIQNKLKAINQLPDLRFDANGWIKTYKNMTTFKDNFYGITWISKVSGAPLRKMLFFNKDLMSTYKQPDIYKMVTNGTWTWDSFEAILKDVVAKSNNTIEGVGAYDYSSLSLGFTASNNATMYKETNGKFVYSGNSANSVEAMEFTAKIVKQKLFASFNPAVDWRDDSLKKFEDSKILFYGHDYYAVDILNEKMRAKYGVVPFPKGPKATKFTSQYGEGKFLMFMGGNSNDVNAAKVLFAIAKRTNDPSWVDSQVSTVLRDKESGEMLKYAVENPTVDCTPLIPQFGVTVLGTLSKISKGETSPKAGLDSVEMTAATNLNDFFKQK